MAISMSMTTPPIDAQVEAVEKATQSIDTCSSSTLRLLRALLCTNDAPHGTLQPTLATTSVKQKRPATKTAAKSTKSPVKRNKANITVLTCSDVPVHHLSSKQQQALATSTFNKTLKTLGDVVKMRQNQNRVRIKLGRSPLKETQGRIKCASPSSESKTPGKGLHSLSPEMRRIRTQSQPPSSDSSSLLTTAECARSALQYLRLLKWRDAANKDLDTQLEQGALVLISKLQSLGFIASATEETLNLRTALDHVLHGQNRGSKDISSLSTHLYPGSLLDCMGFPGVEADARTLGLITAFQVQVLQLLSADKGSRIEDDLCGRLDPETSGSPCFMILCGAQRGWISPEKAAIQLRSLSQCVLSICSIPSDAVSEPCFSSLSSVHRFQLQCLALQIRCHWWKLSGHRPNFDKEIWTPFHHFMQLLRQADTQTAKTQFLLVKESLGRLIAVLPGTRQDLTSTSTSPTYPSSAVLGALQSMAESTCSKGNSLELLHSLKAFCGDLPRVPHAIYHCKLAVAVLMDDVCEIENGMSTMDHALGLLKAPLKGTTTELDQLLAQAARLRKAAAVRLTALNEHLPATESHDEHHKRMCSLYVRIIFDALRFIVRYVGFAPQGKNGASPALKRDRSGQDSISIAQNAMKSALSAVQLCIANECIAPELYMSALADCLTVSRMSKDPQDMTNEPVNRVEKSMACVKISNLFWSHYLKQKDTGPGTPELLSILERSIDALEARSPSEKKNGFLAVKCERAAMLQLDLKQFHKAHQTLVTAIFTHIQTGTLMTAAQKARVQSPQQVWEEPRSPEFMLARVLSAYARLAVKHQFNPTSPVFFDDIELPLNQRALLLERQFVALKETPVPESVHTSLKELAETMLSSHTEHAHSLPRLRLISELLTFCSKHRLQPRNFIPGDALKACLESNSEAPRWQKTPCASTRSLHSSVMLQWAFQTTPPPPPPSFDLLQEFVRSHIAIVETCRDWGLILPKINEPALVISQVQSVIDFADMQGHWQLRIDALLLMQQLLELQPERDTSALASCTTHLGLQYARIGLTCKAGRALETAEAFLGQSESKTMVALQWHLASAECLTALSSYENAVGQLGLAQRRYQVDFPSEQESDSQGSRLARHKYLAQASQVASNIAFEKGDHERAVLHAKKSVRISIRQWTVLEKLLGVKSSSAAQEQCTSTIAGLAEDLSNLNLSNGDPPKQPSVKAAPFWAHVQMHFRSLLHLSRLSAHYSNLQDAVYYAEQAKRVGDAIGSEVLLCEVSSLLAVHMAQAGRADEGQRLVSQCANKMRTMGFPVGSLQPFIAIASAHLSQGEFGLGMSSVEEAQRAVLRIQANDQATSIPQKEDSGSSKPLGKAARSTSRTTRRAGKPSEPQHTAANRRALAACKDSTSAQKIATTEASTWLQKVQAEAYLLKACLLMKSGSPEEAKMLLETVSAMKRSAASDAWYHVLQAALTTDEALHLLRSDAVYSVLAESTTAFPTRSQKGHGNLLRGEIGKADESTTAQASSASRPRKQTRQKQSCSQDGLMKPRELMARARELLSSPPSSWFSGCSSVLARQLAGVLTRIQLISSILLDSPSPNPLQISCHLNEPKSLCWSREAASIRADKVLGGDKSAVFEWPNTADLGKAGRIATGTVSGFDGMDLQHHLIDALPASWNVITIAMSEDHSEMFISKVRRSQSPFLLRLPLHRTTSEDFGDEPFDFHTAKSELFDIISQASLTAHDAKAQSDRAGKKQWWASREALDARLEALLENIQTVWLGGFRGIFSDRDYDQELLSRFSESLSRILDQNLPSRRRKTGSGRQAERSRPQLQLHPHVLQLFVALGNPLDDDDDGDCDEGGDLDDAITDLLYFVIDILQFQGERNAYDEVDFDTMVIEITDALRQYHGAAAQRSSSHTPIGHTILILDKTLHAFPWESLPCLDRQPTSRVPSLRSLQDLLKRLREQQHDYSLSAPPDDGLHIPAHHPGSYILNPSTDLPSTLATFLPSFQTALNHYTPILNRAPTKPSSAPVSTPAPSASTLATARAQFIRGRTIRRLDSCAVTFLWGCSSVALVEGGGGGVARGGTTSPSEFEPTGVPFNYLHAGSPAVLGTLWDVTDRDVDRLAMATFVNWGLLASPSRPPPPPKTKSRPRAGLTTSKGKDNGRYKSEPTTTVSLDAALARSRGQLRAEIPQRRRGRGLRRAGLSESGGEVRGGTDGESWIYI